MKKIKRKEIKRIKKEIYHIQKSYKKQKKEKLKFQPSSLSTSLKLSSFNFLNFQIPTHHPLIFCKKFPYSHLQNLSLNIPLKNSQSNLPPKFSTFRKIPIFQLHASTIFLKKFKERDISLLKFKFQPLNPQKSGKNLRQEKRKHSSVKKVKIRNLKHSFDKIKNKFQ